MLAKQYEDTNLTDQFNPRDIFSLPLPNKITDGLYFKYKNSSKEGNVKSKRLQIFSNIISTSQKPFVVTTIRDQSLYLELEKQKNITLAKTQAFASAAHEFRNPLGAIINSLDLLEDKILQDKGSQMFFKTAKNCSQLMLYLVNDILDFSQLESQKLMLNIDWVEIKTLLEDCINVLKFRSDQKGIDMYYEIHQSFPNKIQTDEHRLRQILINLLSNGIKYTCKGYVKILCYKKESSEQLCIKVQDSGVGIATQDQEKLFSAFNKTKKNRDLNKDGCGLGLTISKNLAQALKGDIIVESQVDKGSNFIVLLSQRYNQFYDLPDRQSHNLVSDDNNEFCKYSNKHDSYREGSLNMDMEKGKNSNHQHSLSYIETPQKPYDSSQNEYNEIQNQFEITYNVDTDRDSMIKIQDYFSPIKSIFPPDFSRQSIIEFQDSPQNYVIPNQSDLDLETLSIEIQEESKILQKCKCPRILIADDDPFNIIAIEGMLNSIGISDIEKVFNGREAIDKIRKNFQEQIKDGETQSCKGHCQYKIILLDNQMPLMNGIDVAQTIRLEFENQIQLGPYRIFLLSGDNFTKMDASLRNAFDDIIIKPISKQKIQEILNL
ncbi:histidine kinase-dna gyrase b-and hsp90-like domain containing protein [Stylonychia lemnae]|uniref:Histidine kinase-dna gyrase b-and hsp90-like domain containing protein n=1 Tax=Stylonychia lemnae TaxID=5949 RepID=A0A077ZUC2_STYLE|nr:histidine kinase-dna gyrase b-and hsp90-like domain containing protein [Stylonychia lemnae]|eukprot:CDW73169.1 histidine kinase-dna gyrase b-and hsp90-like domain containing protein [Stylonychia lemnae]